MQIQSIDNLKNYECAQHLLEFSQDSNVCVCVHVHTCVCVNVHMCVCVCVHVLCVYTIHMVCIPV